MPRKYAHRIPIILLYQRRTWLFAWLWLCCSTSFAQNIFNDTLLHRIDIRFDETHWFDTLTKYYDETHYAEEKKVLRGNVIIDGQHFTSDAGIRFKGEYSYQGFPGKKKPFRVHLAKFDKKQNAAGTEKFNLHNLAGDPSFLREFVAYDFLRKQGLPASRTAFTRLYINDIYWGCYLIVEEPDDDAFLKKNFGTDKGNLFKADTTTDLSWRGADPALYPEISLQTKEKPDSRNTFIDWLDILNNNYQYDFQQQIAHTFETGQYLKVLAADVFMNNWDSYASNGRNFYLYEHPGTKKINWIPWDYNLAFWEKNLPPFPKGPEGRYQPLVWRIYDNDFLKQWYLQTLCRTIETAATAYTLEQRIAQGFGLIRDAVEEDSFKFYTNEDFYKNAQEAVTVKMIRGGMLRDVYLPGLTEEWAQRRTALRKEIMALGCNCDEVNREDTVPEWQVTVFPNPANGQWNLYTENNVSTANYILYCSNGMIVSQGAIAFRDGIAILPASQLAPGNYFLQLQQQKETTTLSLIKK